MNSIDKNKVKEIYGDIMRRIDEKHVFCFPTMDKPMFLISSQYAGVWMEHIYDAVFFGQLEPDRREIAKTTIDAFISRQREDGQLPFGVFANRMTTTLSDNGSYSQIQECLSFAALCLDTYRLTEDREFLERAYVASKKWILWLENNRMTRGEGLVEMFVGFDTGHDNSGRLDGMKCKGNNTVDGIKQPASVMPIDDVTPIIPVDMNCNYYSSLISIAKMADILGNADDEQIYLAKARETKKKLFELCFDEKDAFFYDVDKNGNKRKYLSSTVFHLFMEGVLDPEEDKVLIDRIYNEHIKNPEEFWTEYPFPSMAVSDKSFKKHTPSNCWGYFSQGLIALRCTRWMDRYGYGKDFDHLCERWIAAWTRCYDSFKLGQELDPFTGEPSSSSEWYSSCMLFYIYAARRLDLV